jgi:dTDP-4-dehydrorhamnose reductase
MRSETVVVLGGSGFVGSRLVELWSDAWDIVAPSHAELDLLDHAALDAFLGATSARAIVNAAAWADVDGAEAERDQPAGVVYQLNVALPSHLANRCAELGMHLVHVSTDYVFDGEQDDRPYREDDLTHPLCWYASTKHQGELGVLASGSGCIARIEMPFSGRDARKRDLSRTLAVRLRAGQTVLGVVDQKITPVLLDDAATALQLLVSARTSGVIHVAAADWTTPFEYGRAIATRIGADVELVEPVEFASFVLARPARRPQHPWLDVSQFVGLFGPNVLRPFADQLDRWFAELPG